MVRDGPFIRVFLPHEVEALAATLWGLGRMDRKGQPIEALGEGEAPLPA
ncbi:hypothetical protein [Thermus sp.]